MPKRHKTPTAISQPKLQFRIQHLEQRIAGMKGPEMKMTRRFLEKTLAGLKGSDRNIVR